MPAGCHLSCAAQLTPLPHALREVAHKAAGLSVGDLSQLVHNYLTSVGRAANLILNIGPDDSGAIPAIDMA